MHVRVDLVRRQQLDPLLPHALVLAHRDPDVGVEEVDAGDALVDVVGEREPGTGLLGDPAAGLDEVVARPQVFGGAEPDVHAVACSPRPSASCPCCSGRRRGSSRRCRRRCLSLCSFIVRTSARIWVGWNSSVSPFQTGTPAYVRQRLDVLLGEAAVLDAVEHPAEHPGGVLHRLLVTDLRAARLEVGHVRALVVRRRPRTRSASASRSSRRSARCSCPRGGASRSRRTSPP